MDSRTETLRAGTPLAVGIATLLPIERVAMHAQQGYRGMWVQVTKEPCALVVRDTDGTRAVEIGAGEVSLERLREKIPGLDALLRR